MPIKQHNYFGWEGCQLANDFIELGFAPTIGGRIISLKAFGEELFFANEKHLGETFDFSHININDLEKEKRRLGHRLWGGDKTWVAPEQSWIAFLPPLDLDASPYKVELESNAIIMTSPVDRETGLRIIRRVELADNSEVILKQTFINESDRNARYAIWDVTQLLRPFDIYLPIESRFIQPDKRFDAGIDLREKFISSSDKDPLWSRITCNQSIQFKYGCPVREGLAIAVAERQNCNIAMIRTFAIDPEAQYPGGDMVQVYNASEYHYLELEILSPLIDLSPGKKTSHQQVWRFEQWDKCGAGKFVQSLR